MENICLPNGAEFDGSMIFIQKSSPNILFNFANGWHLKNKTLHDYLIHNSHVLEKNSHLRFAWQCLFLRIKKAIHGNSFRENPGLKPLHNFSGAHIRQIPPVGCIKPPGWMYKTLVNNGRFTSLPSPQLVSCLRRISGCHQQYVDEAG